MVRKFFIQFMILILFFTASSCRKKQNETLTYAVFPYLPDAEYYQEIIERRWAETEPDVKLVRAEWDCYTDGKPEGIDVFMFDAILRNQLIDAGWIQPIDPKEVKQSEDIYAFAKEGLTADGSLYGIPVFLCGNFLVYDQTSAALSEAEHLTDLADLSEILVVNCEFPDNREQYIIEAAADSLGKENPAPEECSEERMELLESLAIEKHKQDDDFHVAEAYDAGTGKGYIGFSESMRLLKERIGHTAIKSISFSEKENIRRLYTDAAAVSADVNKEHYEKCVKLINLMADPDVLTELSVQDGEPQYLMPARKTVYRNLKESFPLYASLEELAGG